MKLLLSIILGLLIIMVVGYLSETSHYDNTFREMVGILGEQARVNKTNDRINWALVREVNEVKTELGMDINLRLERK